MPMLLTILLVIQVISALSIIVLVLLQQGKWADMGSSFGSGSAGSLFGATGAANFLSRTTKWCAVVFFVTTAGLAYMGHNPGGAGVQEGVMQDYDRSVPQAPTVPDAASDAAVPQVPAQPDAGAVAPPASVPQAAAPAGQQAPADDGAKPAAAEQSSAVPSTEGKQ